LVGLDISDGMLRKTRSYLSRSKALAQITLSQGDAVRLPFRDASFDSIFMSFTLELFDQQEIPMVLQECHSVLRAHGQLGVVSLDRNERFTV